MISIKLKSYQQTLDYANELINAQPTDVHGYIDAVIKQNLKEAKQKLQNETPFQNLLNTLLIFYSNEAILFPSFV